MELLFFFDGEVHIGLLFKETQIKVAFQTQNTIQNIAKPEAQIDMRKVAFTK
jgi:hypothetical protein